MFESKLRAQLESEEADNNWAISYGDMITLLLAFFVLFFNIKSESMSLKLVKTEIDKVFKPHVEDRMPASVQAKKTQPTLPLISADVKNLAKLETNLMGDRLLIEFPGISFFKSGSSSLTSDGQKVLQDFSKVLAVHKGLFRMVVRGYTDDKPLKGNGRFKDNLELSAFRSLSAIRHLHKNGLPLSMMRIAGYGESSTALNRKAALARKVVLVLEPLDQTERQDFQNGNSSSAKNIEEVPALKIPSGDGQKVGTGALWTARALAWAEQLEVFSQREYRRVSKVIEKNRIYKSLLIRQVTANLVARGYDRDEAEQKAQSFVNTKGEEQ